MSKMGLHDPFGHMQHKLWQKEMTMWLLTTKSQESMRPPCLQVACDMSLKTSQWELQLCFRPHLDQRSEHEVIASQSCESFNLGNFETLLWEFWDKKSFECGPREEVQIILYGGRWLLPRVWAVMSFVSPRSPMARPSTKGAPTLY
jgi:hypothetical protein